MKNYLLTKRTFLGAAMAAVMALPAMAAEKVTIEVGYPYAHLFDVTFQKIMPGFKAAHPDIEVKFRATYENYEDATNTVLRESIADTLPDVSMQGLNRQALLVEKGIAKSLEPFIAAEANFAKEGYHKAMLGLSTFGGKVYGLPFSISLPVGYYNVDLMASAGITKKPETWEEVIAMCKKMHAKGVRNPMFWGWNITGNWFMQALMWTQDTPIVKDGKVNFDGAAGLTTLETMHKIFRGCKMKNLSFKEALASFSAGEIGMLFWSTSALGSVTRAKGDAFTLETGPFPGLTGKPLGLPAGGNSALLTSTSKDPAVVKAAWTFLKYITSGEGAAAVARTTGYMPPNKAANDIILADFYKKNPNNKVAVDQLPLLRDWLAYPGDKGLAITQILYDGTEGIVTGDFDDMAELQKELVKDVTDMLPKK